MEQTNHETSEFTPDVTETSVKNKTELRTMMLEGNMATLRQDFNNYLHQTPLCTCVVISPHTINFEKANGIKCMAIDNICGRIYGCDEPISHREMMRPSSKVPVIGMCDEHKERMIRHECCPGCGTFCSGGNILVCIKNDDCPHRFHRDCMVLGGQLSECPHCGGDTTSVREVNLTPNMDKDMLMILAGKDPVKMKMKTFLQTRGEKNARMGHVIKKTGYKPVRVPGVTMKFNDLTFDSSKLMIGHERDEFENLLQSLQHEPPQKVRFQAKSFLQFARQNDILKVCIMLIINFELLVYLLLNNADVTIKDEEMGMPCIHHAAKEGYVEGCYLLMIYGRAKINSLDEGGWTPLVWAAEHKHTSMAKFLLHYGADVKIIDKEGNTCLLWAALSGNVDILKMCLDNNTPVDHFNTHGDTALHIAARQDNYNCVFTLLANAANPNIKNSEGETPIECAPERSMCWIALKIHLCIRNAGLFRKVILPYNRERVLNPDISRGYDKLPIICVNARDDAPCPTNPPHGFHYVTENVHTSQDTRINVVISGMQSCQCSDNCGSPSCVCGLISERCWYGNDGTLLPEFDILEPPLIYECNQMCRCSRQCKNRVVQNGIRYRLQVYRTQGMGWGLVALEAMPRGAFVCEYVGELISDDEADQREDDSYLFDLENKDGEIYCIDARNYGNVSRFINHLCEPNLIPIRVFVGHHDIRFPILAYFTTREIQAGEELGFDYGERFWDVKCRQFTCQCGSPVCKYSSEVYKNKAEQELQQHNENNDVTNDVEMKASSANNEIVD
nr:histone-lysine N-methyltransferase EHMT1 [Ciona intestinalis]|eukprot:XP_026691629.1 histone-lysine N-methyltransferase EHMT1 [Ciona intestinalis]